VALLTGQERIAKRLALLLIEQERLAGGAAEKKMEYEAYKELLRNS